MSRLLKQNIKFIDLFSEYKQLIRFNLLCLIKSLPLLITSIIFYLIPIIFVLATHFTNNNLASISWIYLLVIGFFQLIFVNIGIFILYFLNRSNSVDVFFLTKGFKRSSLVISKFLSVLIIVSINSLISTIIIIILLLATGYINLLLSFSMMQFFGNILTSLFIFPIFLGFSLIKNNVVYFILSIVFFLLPVVSIIPRMQENNISQIEKYSNIQTSYAKLYNFYTKKTIAYETVGLSRNSNLFNNLWWSFLPAELMFSPLYYTYQINNNYISNSLSIDMNFMPNINNVVFESTNYQNDNPFVDAIAIRALDDNIFELSDSDIKNKINNALKAVYEYVYNEKKDQTNNFFNQVKDWNIGEYGDATIFEKMFDLMFLDKDTTLFYVYRTIQLDNMSNNQDANVYHQYAQKYRKILGTLNISSTPFQNFINSSINYDDKNKKNTILEYEDSALVKINSTYPIFNITNNENNSVDESDLSILVKNYIKINEINDVQKGYWPLSVEADINNPNQDPLSNPFDPTYIYIKEFIYKWFRYSKYKNEYDEIFGKSDSLFHQFIKDEKLKELANKYSISDLNNIDNWNSVITESFIYCLGGKPKNGILVKGNFKLFKSFIDGLKEYINIDPEGEYWSKHSDFHQYKNIHFKLDNFKLNQDSSTTSFDVKSFGKIKQNTYNNLLVSSLIFLSVSLIIFIWIMYRTIESNKFASKKE